MTSMAPDSSGSPQLGAGVLRFLGSLGQRSEAELYLRIFRQLDRDQFALLVPTAGVLRHRSGTLAEQVRFLTDLGLKPTLCVDALQEPDDGAVAQLYSSLLDVGLEARQAEPEAEGGSMGVNTSIDLESNQVLVVRLRGASDSRLIELANALAPHKTLILRQRGGLGPHQATAIDLGPGHILQSRESGIVAINLRGDAHELRASGVLGDDDAALLNLAERILAGKVGDRARATVSVTSPLAILRELFTVSGAGTLIKRGAAITSHEGWEGVEAHRVRELLEASFGRRVRDDFFEREPLAVHLEADYRGLAYVEKGREVAFLSKFAVLPIARGEGLGQDLWWRTVKSTPSLYFRARVNNPINEWYRTVCDGMHRSGDWIVYWRGASAESLPRIIEDALSRPEDFLLP